MEFNKEIFEKALKANKIIKYQQHFESVVKSYLEISGTPPCDLEYWEQRCLLAEKCLKESPCDPDVTAEQTKAWDAYRKFIKNENSNKN